ncbi:hypothetical protein ACH5RR_003676 [Cinchona calisaya]|uniref:Uncharacterized protein n=1 Tax=Cinchona calisaya TaxID=153742 RepID=A0ABD3AVJ4_9GENT
MLAFVVSRTSYLFHNKRYSYNNLLSIIKSNVHLVSLIKPLELYTHLSLEHDLVVTKPSRALTPTSVCWNFPLLGKAKLNVDGSFISFTGLARDRGSMSNGLNDSFYSWHLDALNREAPLLLAQVRFILNHIYREAKLVTDFLAQLGSGSPNLQLVLDSISTPRTLLSLVHLDAIRTPSIRIV